MGRSKHAKDLRQRMAAPLPEPEPEEPARRTTRAQRKAQEAVQSNPGPSQANGTQNAAPTTPQASERVKEEAPAEQTSDHEDGQAHPVQTQEPNQPEAGPSSSAHATTSDVTSPHPSPDKRSDKPDSEKPESDAEDDDKEAAKKARQKEIRRASYLKHREEILAKRKALYKAKKAQARDQDTSRSRKTSRGGKHHEDSEDEASDSPVENSKKRGRGRGRKRRERSDSESDSDRSTYTDTETSSSAESDSDSESSRDRDRRRKKKRKKSSYRMKFRYIAPRQRDAPGLDLLLAAVEETDGLPMKRTARKAPPGYEDTKYWVEGWNHILYPRKELRKPGDKPVGTPDEEGDGEYAIHKIIDEFVAHDGEVWVLVKWYGWECDVGTCMADVVAFGPGKGHWEPISTWNKGARKMYKKWKENPPDWYAEQRGLYYL